MFFSLFSQTFGSCTKRLTALNGASFVSLALSYMEHTTTIPPIIPRPYHRHTTIITQTHYNNDYTTRLLFYII